MGFTVSRTFVLRWCIVTLLVGWFHGTSVFAVDYLKDESYEERAADVQVADPLEPLNRTMFTVNDKVYLWVIDPVATGYSKVLPADIRTCIGNFFYNLGEPIRSANSLLQGRVRDSGVLLGRFVVNTLFGVFGLADPAATDFKMERIHASFGETLSVWGIGDGFYLVVPLIGPSTLRDLTGTVVDGAAMTTYSPWNDDALTTATVQGGSTINRTSLHLGEYEEIKSLSFDPYIAFRNGYFQTRAKRQQHTNFAQ